MEVPTNPTRESAFVCIWCIWCGNCSPHEPPQAAVLFNTKGLPSGLDRTRGVVEHFRAPVQEEQPFAFGAFGAVSSSRTSHHKQQKLLNFWRIWFGYFTPHEPPQALNFVSVVFLLCIQVSYYFKFPRRLR